MFDYFIHFISQSPGISHTPQAAVAALLCAALIGFLN
ncbi:YshB family small membrane protein [Duffyella gerundensis]|nr:YshB family small membrane protein [Duffyella gerundensis]